jgi:hypothetical protein
VGADCLSISAAALCARFNLLGQSTTTTTTITHNSNSTNKPHGHRFKPLGSGYRAVAMQLASSHLLATTPPHQLLHRIEEFARAARCSEALAARAVLAWPDLAAGVIQPGNQQLLETVSDNVVALEALVRQQGAADAHSESSSSSSSAAAAAGRDGGNWSHCNDNCSSSSSNVHVLAGLQSPDVLLALSPGQLAGVCGELQAAGLSPGEVGRAVLNHGLAALPLSVFLTAPRNADSDDDGDTVLGDEGDSDTGLSTAAAPHHSTHVARAALDAALDQVLEVISDHGFELARQQNQAAAGPGVYEQQETHQLPQGQARERLHQDQEKQASHRLQLLRGVVACGCGALLQVPQLVLRTARHELMHLVVGQQSDGGDESGANAHAGTQSSSSSSMWRTHIAALLPAVVGSADGARSARARQLLATFLCHCPWVLLWVCERRTHSGHPSIHVPHAALRAGSNSGSTYINPSCEFDLRLPNGKRVVDKADEWLAGPHPLAGRLQASLLRIPTPAATVAANRRSSHAASARKQGALNVLRPALRRLQGACGLRTQAAAWLLWLCYPQCMVLPAASTIHTGPASEWSSALRTGRNAHRRAISMQLSQSVGGTLPVVVGEALLLDEVQGLIRRLAVLEVQLLQLNESAALTPRSGHGPTATVPVAVAADHLELPGSQQPAEPRDRDPATAPAPPPAAAAARTSGSGVGRPRGYMRAKPH